MSKYFYKLIFVLTASTVSAQQIDTVHLSKKTLRDTITLPSGKIDSVASKLKYRTDSVNSQLKNIQSFKIKTPKSKKADSIKQATLRDINKPTTIEKQLTNKLDSLNPEQRVAQYNKKISVLEKHLSYHIDSISKLNIKDPRLTKSTDSLRGKLDSLKNAGPIKDIAKAEQQLAKIQSGMNSKVKGLEGKVNQELGSLSKLGGANLNVPNLNVPNLNVPSLNTNLPSNLGLNGSLPNVSISAGNTSIPSNNLSIPGSTQPNISGSTSSSNLTNSILPSGEIANIQKDAGQLTKATGEISKVEVEVKNLNPDNLEKEAQNSKELKQLSGEAAQAEQYKKMMAKWQSDPEYRKEMAVTQAKEQGINHFAGQEKQLMGAMQQLTNVKKKYKDYEGALDMFKKPGNSMKGKPLIERLRPGFNLQFQSKREFLLDFNPQVGYRFSGKFTAGIGWNERWGYDFNKWNYISQDHIFGPRGYGQFKIKTGIYAMLAPEVMNTLVPPSFNSSDPGARKWIWSWIAGMKKEFQYTKKTTGNIQLLYNIYDRGNQSPYTSKLIVRMGFEFPQKRK